MKCLLTTCNVILSLSVFSSKCDAESNAVDLPVLPIQQPVTQLYIGLNASFCQVTDNVPQPGIPYFVYNMTTEMINKACDGSQVLDIPAPDYIFSNMDDNEIFVNKRVCLFKHKHFFTAICQFNFKRIIPANVPITQRTDLKASTTNTTTILSNSDENLFIYIAAGAALTIVIALQISCIVIYSRKVKSTSTALTNILRRRSRVEENDRYSRTPAAKKTSKDYSKNEEEENVYESLEKLAANKAKLEKQGSESETVILNRIKERPPLPLPAQIAKSDGDGDSIRSFQQRPPLPLPHETQPSGMETRTLPSKASQRRFNDKLPEPPATSMTLLRPPPRPTPSPIFRKPIPHKPSPHTTPKLGVAERIPEPPQANLIRTLPQQDQPVLPKNLGGGNVMNELNKVLQKKQNPFPSNSLHQPRPPLSRMASTSKQTTTSTFHHVPPPPSVVNTRTNESRHSSDDEWTTYDKLPPNTKYLR